MRLQKINILFLIMALTLGWLNACTKIDDDRPTTERIKMTGEYLDLLGAYNSASREFSRAVKPMQETEKRMNAEFNEAYWSKYDEQKAKAVKEIHVLKNYQFRFEPYKEIKTDFKNIASRMEDYNGTVDRMRESTKQWTPEKKKEFYAALDPIYADIFQQSKTIVTKIDAIYNRVFVVGENKK